MPNEFHFPAEWETHQSTWLTWPHNRETWPNNLAAAQLEFEAFARTIADVETVRILAVDQIANDLLQRFGSNRNIEVVPIATNDSWIRDYGPTFVRGNASNNVVGINWIYNGWGEKYPPFDLDAIAAARILAHCDLEKIDSGIILEGGAIETNGDGICLSTRSCLFNANRDASFSEQEIVDELKQKLGSKTIILIDPIPIVGDDTNGHIDQVARFVSGSELVVSKLQLDTVQHAIQNNEHCPENTPQIHALPEPGTVTLFGSTLPASYANFYFGNGIVIVPQFDVPHDDNAIAMLQELIPDRQVIGLPSRNLAAGLGSFHCLSQQQPA